MFGALVVTASLVGVPMPPETVTSATQAVGPILHLDAPRPEQTVRKHYVTVSGRFTSPVPHYEIQADLTARGLHGYAVLRRDGSFRGRLALKSGTTTVRIAFTHEDEYGDVRTLARRTVRVRRAQPAPPSPDGSLDLATAWFVARNMLYLCGEAGGGCSSQPYCVRVDRARVDCPSAVAWEPGYVERCAEVWSVIRDPEGRVFAGRYDCPTETKLGRGRARPLVQSWQQPPRRRFTEDDGLLLYTPYGVPEFDVTRDVLAR